MSDNNNNSGKLQRFGRYLILDHLVDGGMAKICRARFLGEQADKLVAIKMVQPQFSKDPNFKTMFMDEIKVAFSLLHPNIAQTYDYGIYQEQLYTAMEYIDGANLKQYLDRLKEKNYVFPVEISAYITAQICQGLHYAHTFTDKLSGKPLNLVHRDISPHNIMLTYDGAIKVIDFGIAKAETNSEATQAGTIKGKLSYLAPEYLDGLTLDHRYDQFAVGITLWELLCSRKLFQAANDLAVLKLIQACKIPAPSSINPNVPKELDRIVLKALSKDRTNRYENLDKFNRDLVKFLYATYPDFNSSDLSFFAKELFKDEIKRDKAKFMEYGKIDITSYLEELKNELNNGQNAATNGNAPLSNPDKTVASGFSPRREIDLELSEDQQSVTSSITLEVAGIGGPVKKRPAADSTTTAKKSTPGTTARGNVKIAAGTQARDKSKISNLDKSEKKSSPVLPVIILVAGLGAICFLYPDLVLEYTGIDLGIGGAEKTIASGNAPEVNPARVKRQGNGVLTLSGLDPYMEVYINDEKVSYSGVGIKQPFNKEILLRVEKEHHASFNTKFTLTKESPNTSIVIPELEKVRYGLLSSSNNYTEGSVLKITVNGQEMEKTLPLDNYRIPAGTYEGIVKDPLLGTEKNVTFTVEDSMKATLE
ncbi:MAG: serine/threonine protein kinase [Bacteriovoracaceae bacterium]